MRFPFTPTPMAGLAALLLLLGCGGAKQSQDITSSAHAPVKAGALVYTAPTGAGYQLVKDASSSSTHLVLGLVGPAGAQLKGVVLTLNADAAKATWSNPGGTVDSYIKEGQVLALGAGTKLMKSQLSGASLQLALFQKGNAAAATLGAQPLLSVALDLKAGATPGPVSLSSATAQILDPTGTTQAITVAVGTLTAQ